MSQLDKMNRTDSGARADEASRRRKSDPKADARFHREAIEFLIYLSNTDPAALAASERPGDLPNLIMGLWRFGIVSTLFRFGRVSPSGDLRRDVEQMAQAVRANSQLLRPTIELVGKLLATTADGGSFEWPLVRGTSLVFDRASKPAWRMTMQTPRGASDLEQSVTFSAMLLLSNTEGEMVRRCARQACKRIFLAVRPKQVFCGRRCASAAAFERYKQERGQDAFKAEHRTAARVSWRRKQRKLGRTVKPRIKDDKGVSGR
jgi:hypothetical protein